MRLQNHFNAAIPNSVDAELDQTADRRERNVASKHSFEEISPAHRLTCCGQGLRIVPANCALARELCG
ncbi:hypothetical protein BF49_3470 [Bradyrhizobium sp.]|nr:hypothetical protein BF49_3470 [Bradyrhizobium sp.]